MELERESCLLSFLFLFDGMNSMSLIKKIETGDDSVAYFGFSAIA